MFSLLPLRNLVLVVDEVRCDPADFVDIAGRIHAKATDIRVQVLQPKTIHSVARDTWDHPTLLVCLVHFPDLKIKRGRTIVTRPIPKMQQCEMMQLANISTPHIERYRFGMDLDEATWGKHVVLKPEDLRMTSKGTGLEIITTSGLSGKQKRDFPTDHFAHEHEMLVTRFIDTGPQPSRYRALTFLGEVLYLSKSTYMPMKSEAGDVPADFHSKAPEVKREFEPYPQIHAFASKLAAAFKDWPLLGCDILEEHQTGKLYAIEVNAGGNVWHFSSRYNAEDRRKNPAYNAARLSQYNAFDTAAKALISATRRLAV